MTSVVTAPVDTTTRDLNHWSMQLASPTAVTSRLCSISAPSIEIMFKNVSWQDTRLLARFAKNPCFILGLKGYISDELLVSMLCDVAATCSPAAYRAISPVVRPGLDNTDEGDHRRATDLALVGNSCTRALANCSAVDPRSTKHHYRGYGASRSSGV